MSDTFTKIKVHLGADTSRRTITIFQSTADKWDEFASQYNNVTKRQLASLAYEYFMRDVKRGNIDIELLTATATNLDPTVPVVEMTTSYPEN